MKRNDWMALIATTILMFAVCLSASAKRKKKRRARNDQAGSNSHSWRT